MTISEASGHLVAGTWGGGGISSISFLLDGDVLGQGTWNYVQGGVWTPALFDTPVTLHGGVTYGLVVDTYLTIDFWHLATISAPDGLISNINFTDTTTGQQWAWFPSLQLSGPVPEPSLVSLTVLGIVSVFASRLPQARRAT
jgi:hypothetical protein